jgi:UDP-N-acetylmuramate dehydrogenase
MGGSEGAFKPQHWRELEVICPGGIRYGVPMSSITTLGVGGPADVLVEPSSPQEACRVIQWASRMGIPLLIMGRGSNLLVLDGGIRGIVLRISRRMAGLHWKTHGRSVLLRALAGTPISRLMCETLRRGWGGVEFLAGIPASLGGAVAMNAGTASRWMEEVIEGVTLALEDGTLEMWARERLSFGYRKVALPPNSAIVGVELRLHLRPKEKVRGDLLQRTSRRKATQPAPRRTAGSVFKNPPGDFAGRLIEACGLKGMTLGGATVSEVHANFIVTGEGARAQDVLMLMEEIQRRVQRETGVLLEPEIRVIGEPR